MGNDNKIKIFQSKGTMKDQRELQLDVPLPFTANARVRVTVSIDTDDEKGLLAFVANDPVFSDIFDDSEDIYTLEDGKPFNG